MGDSFSPSCVWLDVVIILVVSVAEEIQEKLNMHGPATMPLSPSLSLSSTGVKRRDK
jgi:hypothetical protein